MERLVDTSLPDVLANFLLGTDYEEHLIDSGCEYALSQIRKCGRKKKIIPRAKRKLILVAKTNRRGTNKNLKMCDSTVCRKLIAVGFCECHSRKKAKILPATVRMDPPG